MGKGQELLDAAREGNRQIVEKILGQIAKRSGPFTSLRKGAGVNVQDDSGYTPLHHACLRGHKEIVRLLLSVDASPCIVDKKGATALHLAAWKGDSGVVAMLLSHANPQVNVDQLTSDQESALLIAAQFGNVEVVAQLLERGAVVTIRNNKDESALDLAAQYGRLETVQLLLRARPQLVDLYRLPGCRVGLFSSTPLHRASRNGHKEVVATLIRAGVYPNIRTHAGTALHEAVFYGKASVVSVLLQQGADLYAADRRGKTIHDLLDEYSEDATKRVRKIIRDHMKHAEYESEEDLPPFPVQDISPTGYPNTGGMKPSETQKNYSLGLSSSSSSILTKNNHKNIVQKIKSIFNRSDPNISNSASESDISKKSKSRSSTGTLNIANSKFFKKRVDESAVVNCDDEFENWNGRLCSRNDKINQSTRSNASCPLPYIVESTEPGDSKDSDSDSTTNELTENNNKIDKVCKAPAEAINRMPTLSIFEPRDGKENNARISNISADSFNIVNDCYVSYDEVNKKNDTDRIHNNPKSIPSPTVTARKMIIAHHVSGTDKAEVKSLPQINQNIPTVAKPMPAVTQPSAPVIQPSTSPVQLSASILRTAPTAPTIVPLQPSAPMLSIASIVQPSAPILSTARIDQPPTPVLRRAPPIPAARTHIPTKPTNTENRIVYENVTPKPQARNVPDPLKRTVVPAGIDGSNNTAKLNEDVEDAGNENSHKNNLTSEAAIANEKDSSVTISDTKVNIERAASNVPIINISKDINNANATMSFSRTSNLSSESEEDEANFEDILLSVKSRSFRLSDDRNTKLSVQRSQSIDSDSSDENSALDDVDCSSDVDEQSVRYSTGTLPNKKKDNTKKKVLFRHKTFSTIRVDKKLIPKYFKESTETLTNYHIRGTGHCVYKAPTLQEFISMFNRDNLGNKDTLKRKSTNESAICFCKSSPRKFHKSAEDLQVITVQDEEDEEKVTINVEDLQREVDLNLTSFQCFCYTGVCAYHTEKRSSQNLCVKFSVINKSISTPDITLLGTPSPTTTRPVFPNFAPLTEASETPEDAATEGDAIDKSEATGDSNHKDIVKDASLPYSTLSSTYSQQYSVKDISDGLGSLPSNPHSYLRQTSSGCSLQTCTSNATLRSSLSYTTCEEEIDSSDDDTHSVTDNSDETVSCSETSSAKRPWVDSDSFKFGSNESVLATTIPEESEESMDLLDGVPLLSLERLRGGGVRSGGRRRWDEAEGGSEGDALSVSSAASSCAPHHHLAQQHEFSKVSPTPPKKPPRRNLSVSPTHANSPSSGYSYELRAHARSQDDLDDLQGAKNYLKHGRSVDQYVDNKLSYPEYEEYHPSPKIAPKPKPRPSLNLKNRPQPVAITTTYENVTIMEQNPKRKLRRDFENYNPRTNERVRKYSAQERSSLESLLDDAQSVNSPSDCERYDVPGVGIPLSPTHYDQPPTPEHPPPSARQAENSIHERIRPLSQRIMEVIEEIRIRKKSQGDL